ncbi:MAG: Uma2 family endonuclease [bacterium]
MGDLCLPVQIAIQLGLELCGIELYELADRTIQRENVFKARSEIITKENIRGAPDLAIEILSPATSNRDRTYKKALYAR